MGRSVAFLDRDGVINRDHGYVSRWADFEFMPDAIEGMRLLVNKGYALVVVTNQSGIGRGYYSEQDFEELSHELARHLAAEGIPLLATYHCPHHPTAGRGVYGQACDCRKPAPGMLLQAATDHAIDLPGSLIVGDKPSDMAAGKAAGLGLLYQVTAGETVADATGVSSLLEAAQQAPSHSGTLSY